MKATFETIFYEYNEIFDRWELWATGETEYGESFTIQLDLDHIEKQLKDQGIPEYNFLMAVNTPGKYNSIDIFLTDINDNTNKVLTVKTLFQK